MTKRNVVLCAATACLVLGGAFVSEAAAASRFGPTGLGSNLHRRFVIKQAIKRSNNGQSVSNRAILWKARPYTRGVIRTRSAWRRW